MNLATCLAVALGGALGSVGRYALAGALAPISQGVPWGTVMINIAGSFVIGFFGTLTLSHGRFPVPETLRLFVLVGLCGGFTTFSSFSLQTLDLLRAGAVNRALVNVGASVVLCLVAVALGHAVAAQLNGGAVSAMRPPIADDA
ncbi:fluoride efflux transporter CrcB [Lichenibacterium minor]|uniref:Fluoride-specific ion channel FluC n=1 Tax=Lichenibacterium minor TaxID=2316528 RepID=A0A4Q2U6G8_9HYPH|nr:fluoride efflux transporter CrcB [Lichenibacterium minor]RYC30597.1 fluoride efflux transporter CrcB [Lichenibacterium minor]